MQSAFTYRNRSTMIKNRKYHSFYSTVNGLLWYYSRWITVNDLVVSFELICTSFPLFVSVFSFANFPPFCREEYGHWPCWEPGVMDMVWPHFVFSAVRSSDDIVPIKEDFVFLYILAFKMSLSLWFWRNVKINALHCRLEQTSLPCLLHFEVLIMVVCFLSEL